jgi:hypothetical protein
MYTIKHGKTKPGIKEKVEKSKSPLKIGPLKANHKNAIKGSTGKAKLKVKQ